jgi:demethylmenaquinone methyltransferase/2-methoxy-6-polyprenyl-1,4-benzoquinol methylase
MFDRIARRYDLLNRLLSLGADQRWRRKAAAALRIPAGGRVLDVAAGTADLALALAESAPDVIVEGIDPSVRMLALGRSKVEAAGLSGRISLREGVAEQLPYSDQSFDGVAIAFGIRNVPDRSRALREMARILKPGARAAVLELSTPGAGLFALPARLWIARMVPLIGGLLSGPEEYSYLRDSIDAFPDQDEFARLMADAGLLVRDVSRFSLGACVLFIGEAPGAAA